MPFVMIGMMKHKALADLHLASPIAAESKAA